MIAKHLVNGGAEAPGEMALALYFVVLYFATTFAVRSS